MGNPIPNPKQNQLEPETRFKPQDKIYIEWPQFALTNNRFKGCSYVQDTDENLVPLGQNVKKLWLLQSHLTKPGNHQKQNKPNQPQQQTRKTLIPKPKPITLPFQILIRRSRQRKPEMLKEKRKL